MKFSESFRSHRIDNAIHFQALPGVFLRQHSAVFSHDRRLTYIRKWKEQRYTRLLYRKRFFDSLKETVKALSVFCADPHALHAVQLVRVSLVNLV